MAEQILAAHPAVVTGDELDLCLPLLHDIGEMVGGIGLRPLLDQLDELSEGQLARLRSTYREGLIRGVPDASGALVMVDKHPLRVIDLGLINHQRSRVDRRSVRISLTEDGQDIAETVAKLYERHIGSIQKVGGIGSDEFTQMNKLLQRLDRFWNDSIMYRL